MSVRLQVLLDDAELRDIRRVARGRRMTVSEWVRGALRAARRAEPAPDTRRKIDALRVAAAHSFPAPDIDRMLEEIARGYGAGLP